MLYSDTTQFGNHSLYMKDIKSDSLKTITGISELLWLCYEEKYEGPVLLSTELEISFVDKQGEVRTMSKTSKEPINVINIEGSVIRMVKAYLDAQEGETND